MLTETVNLLQCKKIETKKAMQPGVGSHCPYHQEVNFLNV